MLHARGGTSTGLAIWERIVPRELALREELIRHLMGVPLEGNQPGNRQITGLGRGAPTSNKVFLTDVERDAHGHLRLVSTLAQLAAERSAIDWSVNCGNMSAALPLWAIDQRMVPVDKNADNFEIDIFNTNTSVTTTARMSRSNGQWVNSEIPGVNGSFPSVDLFLADPVGAKTGKLLPTGAPVDQIDKYSVSCVDVAVPMMIARASDFGKTGSETIADLEKDRDFMAALKKLWVEAGLRMALRTRDGSLMTVDQLAQSETIPKVCIVGPPTGSGHIATRYFTPQAGHNAMAVSGGCCLAAACLIPGTVAHKIARNVSPLEAASKEVRVDIENPAGILSATIEGHQDSGGIHITRAAYQRSGQILMRGAVPLYRASAALKKALGEIASMQNVAPLKAS